MNNDDSEYIPVQFRVVGDYALIHSAYIIMFVKVYVRQAVGMSSFIVGCNYSVK